MKKTFKALKNEYLISHGISHFRLFFELFISYFSGVMLLQNAVKIVSNIYGYSVPACYQEISELEKIKLIKKITYGKKKVLVARNLLLINFKNNQNQVRNINSMMVLSQLKYVYLSDNHLLNRKAIRLFIDFISKKQMLIQNKNVVYQLRAHNIILIDYKINTSDYDSEAIEKVYFLGFLKKNTTKRQIIRKVKMLEELSSITNNGYLCEYRTFHHSYEINFYSQKNFSGLTEYLNNEVIRDKDSLHFRQVNGD